jgi:hypothetical protein
VSANIRLTAPLFPAKQRPHAREAWGLCLRLPGVAYAAVRAAIRERIHGCYCIQILAKELRHFLEIESGKSSWKSQ